MRLPQGANTKGKYRDADGHPWQVRLTQWTPELRYSAADLIDAFGPLAPAPRALPGSRKAAARAPGVVKATPSDRVLLVGWHGERLRAAGLVVADANARGWATILCPWRQHHTPGGGQTAGWNGHAFHCFHHSCATRTTRDLNVWLMADEAKAEKHLLSVLNGNGVRP